MIHALRINRFLHHSPIITASRRHRTQQQQQQQQQQPLHRQQQHCTIITQALAVLNHPPSSTQSRTPPLMSRPPRLPRKNKSSHSFSMFHSSHKAGLSASLIIPRSHSILFLQRRHFTSILSSATVMLSPLRNNYYSSTSNDKNNNNNNNNNNSNDPKEQTLHFLQTTLRYPPAISNGILTALLSSGTPPSSLLSMTKSLAGRYEVGEDGGLETLAASVRRELDEREKGKTVGRVKVWCLPGVGWSPSSSDDIDFSTDAGGLPIVHDMDRAFQIEAMEGTNLSDLIKFGHTNGSDDNVNVLGEYLECACSGIMACSTCHVVIHPDWYDFGNDNNNNNDSNNDNEKSNKRRSNKVPPPSEAEQDMIDLAFEPQLTSRLGCQIVLTKELDGLIILLPKGSNNLMDFVPFD